MKNLLLPFLLAACAAPETIFKPVPVDMPVAIPCRIVPVPAPDFATAHITTHDDLFTKIRAALVELEQRKAYEVELNARIKTCS